VNFSQDVDGLDPLAGPGPVVHVTDMFWHPEYPVYPPWPWAMHHDVGVMTLKSSVVLDEYAQLLPLGLFGQMKADGPLPTQLFTPVGYGCAAAWPAPSGPQPWRTECPFDRTIGTGTYLALTPFWVKVSQNYPSTGSSGYGAHDSGTPSFLDDTYMLAGVMGGWGDPAGTAFGLVDRLDMRSNRSFVMSFLEGS
jgi:hypothetical protein